MKTQNNNHVILGSRTLGLPASAERALMGRAYENYATAWRQAVAAHNRWRRLRRQHGDPDPRVKEALTVATKASLYRADAKAQYRQAKRAAQLAGAAA